MVDISKIDIDKVPVVPTQALVGTLDTKAPSALAAYCFADLAYGVRNILRGRTPDSIPAYSELTHDDLRNMGGMLRIYGKWLGETLEALEKSDIETAATRLKAAVDYVASEASYKRSQEQSAQGLTRPQQMAREQGLRMMQHIISNLCMANSGLEANLKQLGYSGRLLS